MIARAGFMFKRILRMEKIITESPNFDWVTEKLLIFDVVEKEEVKDAASAYVSDAKQVKESEFVRLALRLLHFKVTVEEFANGKSVSSRIKGIHVSTDDKIVYNSPAFWFIDNLDEILSLSDVSEKLTRLQQHPLSMPANGIHVESSNNDIFVALDPALAKKDHLTFDFTVATNRQRSDIVNVVRKSIQIPATYLTMIYETLRTVDDLKRWQRFMYNQFVADPAEPESINEIIRFNHIVEFADKLKAERNQ